MRRGVKERRLSVNLCCKSRGRSPTRWGLGRRPHGGSRACRYGPQVSSVWRRRRRGGWGRRRPRGSALPSARTPSAGWPGSSTGGRARDAVPQGTGEGGGWDRALGLGMERSARVQYNQRRTLENSDATPSHASYRAEDGLWIWWLLQRPTSYPLLDLPY